MIDKKEFEKQCLCNFAEPRGDVVAAYEFYEREAELAEKVFVHPNGTRQLIDHNNLAYNFVEIDPQYRDKYRRFIQINGAITTFYKLHRYAAFRHDCDFDELWAYPGGLK